MGCAFRLLVALAVAVWLMVWSIEWLIPLARGGNGRWPLFCVVPRPIPADIFLDVTVHNATGEPVVFYKFARWRGQRPGERFDPGEEAVTGYRVEPCATVSGHPAAREEVAFVQAVDEQGRVVFCRRYTYEDLIAAGRRIEISTEAGGCP